MKEGGVAKGRHADVQILQKKARVTARLVKENNGLSKALQPSDEYITSETHRDRAEWLA